MTTKVKKKLTVEDVIHPVELNYQRSIPEMVLDWTNELVLRLQADYDRQYKSNSNPCNFAITSGRKYHKILDTEDIAKAIIKIILENSYVRGAIIPLDNGFSILQS